MIWTTTTWTLPANEAICLNGALEYSFVKFGGEYHIMATDLVDSVMKACGITEYEVVGQPVPGSEFELMRYQHVYLPKEGLVILGRPCHPGERLRLCHTAGGHGVDDFNVSQKYNVPITVPVDDGGYLTELAGKYAGPERSGLPTRTISWPTTASGAVLGPGAHQAPVSPLLALPQPHHLPGPPSSGSAPSTASRKTSTRRWTGCSGCLNGAHDRMYGMVRDAATGASAASAPGACPSLPSTARSAASTTSPTPPSRRSATCSAKEGSDAWYKYSAEEIIPAGEVCENCGGIEWTKDTDIMDVWFDSGSTWSAVLEERDELRYPRRPVYGGRRPVPRMVPVQPADQCASRGGAPYKAVLCHGWVVDEQGKQMHKSAGNGVEPAEIIKDYGADIIRLWVASSDYTVDVRAGKNIFKQLSEAYRKIRNTARFILGNLDGFDPNTDMLPDDQLQEIDRWALARSG